MKISIMTINFYKAFMDKEIDIKEFIDYCSSIGADGCEISEMHTNGYTKEEIKDMLTKYNLQLSSYILNADFVFKDEAQLKAEVEKCYPLLDKALFLGTNHVMVSPGGRKEGYTDEEVRDLICKGFNMLISYAKTKGVTISTENHGGLVDLRGKRAHMIEFMEKCPDLAMVWDNGNYLMGNEDTLEALNDQYAKVVHVHFKDLKNVDGKYVGVPLMTGDVPTKSCVDELKKRGYNGWISIEYSGATPPKEGTKIGLNNLKGILK